MMSDGTGLSALDDFQKQVEQDEAEAEAYEELVGEESHNMDAALEDKYNTSNADLDDDVAKMMAAAKKKK